MHTPARPRELAPQVSLIIAFALDERTGDCPTQWRDPATGAVAAPHHPSFDEP